jgi:transposase InsO family protein
MPWESRSVMDEKLRFVSDCLGGLAPMAVLCERYGISRQTGYVWLGRYRAEGPSGLEERSRAPLHHGRAMSAEVALRLIEARRRKPYWGPRKLLAVLCEEDPLAPWPSPSAVSDLFRREGLSQPRRRRRRMLEHAQPFREILAPNDSWCIDFKGWFRSGDGRRCDPLTVTDAYSRYLLELRIVEPSGEAVKKRMDRLFRERGLPRSIRSDNGAPFASIGAGGLTRLSAYWAKLGIRLERIEPGKPQQNGRHERMHGTLKKEACSPPQPTLARQQRRFDAFRQEYNEERPHEALGQRPPAGSYRSSPRPFPSRIEDPVYEADDQLRRVRTNGEIKWRGSRLFVSAALIGEVVAVSERDDGHWHVRFADIPLLLIDRSTGKTARYGPGRPPRSVTRQTAAKVSGM